MTFETDFRDVADNLFLKMDQFTKGTSRNHPTPV